MASRIRSSTSLCVAPVATQPGKSGENADKFLGVFSITIRYFVCTILVLESGLPENTVESARSDVILGMSGNRYSPRFCWMFVLAMATFLSDHYPAIIFNYTLNVSNIHEFAILLG